MKNSLILITASLLLLVSCQKETIDTEEDIDTNYSSKTNRSNDGEAPYPSNQAVIQYVAGLNEDDKQQLRDRYNVISVRTCPCGDPRLEEWTFEDTGDGTIEEKVVAMNEDDGLKGDLNPYIFLNNAYLPITPSPGPDAPAVYNNLSSENDAYTVAVIDTGLKTDHFTFNNVSPFLYNAQQSGTACQNETYGWNFVDQNNDPYDNHGHGTIVSGIIRRKMAKHNKNVRIIPIKAFDDRGEGSYFKTLCGFQYAANNPDVDVIHMSLGFYHNYEMLLDFIKEVELEGEKIVIASAGNETLSTDSNPHIPSSYPLSNIISVASLRKNEIKLADHSNHGEETVDLAAVGEGIPFMRAPGDLMFVDGTSFAAAITSAFAGAVHIPGINAQDLRNDILSKLQYSENLFNIGTSSYISINF